MNLEYVRVHVVYRVNYAEYVIRMLVAAPQEYANTLAHSNRSELNAEMFRNHVNRN
jgi:hypothetical protein